MNHYFLNIIISLDQSLNTLFGGCPDETMSASLWRHREIAHWNIGYRIVNAIFFWQHDHCFEAYTSEILRKQYPKSYQKG